jgi:hypothetical protein
MLTSAVCSRPEPLPRPTEVSSMVPLWPLRPSGVGWTLVTGSVPGLAVDDSGPLGFPSPSIH